MSFELVLNCSAIVIQNEFKSHYVLWEFDCTVNMWVDADLPVPYIVLQMFGTHTSHWHIVPVSCSLSSSHTKSIKGASIEQGYSSSARWVFPPCFHLLDLCYLCNWENRSTSLNTVPQRFKWLYKQYKKPICEGYILRSKRQALRMFNAFCRYSPSVQVVELQRWYCKRLSDPR